MPNYLIAFVSIACTVQNVGCRNQEPPPGGGSSSSSTISSGKDPERARAAIARGAVVIDVRTPEEYEGDHLPNATNIPVQELKSRSADVERLVGGDKTRPIVVHCASGKRAATAKSVLDASGYTDVINGGGVDDLR